MHGKIRRVQILIAAIFALCAIVSLNYAQQTPPAQTRQSPQPAQGVVLESIGEERVAEAQLRTTRSNPKIVEAIGIITARGEEPDYAKARNLKFQQTAPNERRIAPTVIVIPIKARAGQQAEYAKLVYEKGIDGKEIVYFDEPTGHMPAPQGDPSTAKIGFGCGSWSLWVDSGSECRNTYLACLLNNQKAFFVTYHRERQCRNGLQTQTKTVRLRCDC